MCVLVDQEVLSDVPTDCILVQIYWLIFGGGGEGGRGGVWANLEEGGQQWYFVPETIDT